MKKLYIEVLQKLVDHFKKYENNKPITIKQVITTIQQVDTKEKNRIRKELLEEAKELKKEHKQMMKEHEYFNEMLISYAEEIKKC